MWDICVEDFNTRTGREPQTVNELTHIGQCKAAIIGQQRGQRAW